jgi:hypothetical protein
MAKKSLQEHIDRIKQLSGIQYLNENEEEESMATQETPEEAEDKFSEMLDDPETVDAFADGIGELVKDLSDEIGVLGNKVGDKDGALEPNYKEMAEGLSKLNEAEPISLTIGALLAAPKIIDMLGKGVKQLGGVADSDTIRNAGVALSKAGHKAHDAYKNVIVRAIKALPEYKDKYTDEQIGLVANGVLLAATVGFGIMSLSGAASAIKAGNTALAAVEGGLTGVKGAEIAAGAKDLVPRILNGFMS